MEYISEGAIDYGSNYQSARRSEQPSIGNQDAVLLQRTQHVTPTRHRLIHSKTEEGECYFGGNIPRNEQRRLGKQHPKSFGQNVTPEEVEIRSAKAAGRQNVVTVTGAENHSSHQPGGPGPAKQAEYAGQQKERADRTQMQRQEGPHPKQEIEPGQREKQLRYAHQRLVNPPAVVARDDSENASGEKRNESCRDSSGDRNLAADQDARQFIPAITVGPKEQDLAWLRNSEQMRARFVDPKKLVTRPTYKELNWIFMAAVFLITSLITIGLIAAQPTRPYVHKRT